MSASLPSSSVPLEARAGVRPGAAAFAVPIWYGALLIAALLLAAQPYRGVRHDATLYLGQALIRLDPSWWHSDVYFAFGSQDKYSIFSRLLTWPVAAVGIPATEMIGLTLGRAATFLALFLMLDGWPPLRRWLALAMVAGTAHFYGGKTFAVLEPFFTARTFAEPACLLAIAAVLRGRKAWAAAALAVGFVIHPLIALPAALVIWSYLLVAEGRRWLWAGAVAVLAALALAAAGVAPFDGLLRRYDDDWFTVVGFVTSTAFVSEWQFQAYVAVAGYSVIVWGATHDRKDPLARLSRVASVVGPLCCALSFWLADWEHFRLLTQLQFWRAAWIAEVLSALWLPHLVIDHWRRGPAGRVAAASLCAGWMIVQDDMGLYGWAILLWIAVWLVLSLRGRPIERRVLRLAFLATVLMGTVALGQHCWDAIYQMRADVRGYALTYPASIPFRIPLLTLPAVGLLLAAWQKPRARRACAALAVALACVSAWQTDQRDAFTRFIESAAPAQRPFQAEIPPTARVFWYDNQLAPVWLLLHRAAFGEPAQFSGAIFVRQNALAARDIWNFLAGNVRRQQHCGELQSWMSNDYIFRDCIEPVEGMQGYCVGDGPHPDFIVSPVLYPLPQRSHWTFRPPDGGPPMTYHLYACSAIRASAPPTAASAAAAAPIAATPASTPHPEPFT